MCAPRSHCTVSRRRLPLAEACIFRLFLPGRTPIRTAPLTCPNCNGLKTRRSRRRSVLDHLFGFGNVLPWRCEACEARFYARTVPFRNLFHAHCGICGNLELQRISAEHVPGIASILGRVLRVPALRCEPCRNKFFSVLPMFREERRAEVTPIE